MTCPGLTRHRDLAASGLAPASPRMNDSAVTVEDAVSFKEQKKEPLYAAHVKIYPKAVAGRFRRIKWAVLGVLLGIYYVVPWLRWDRGPGAPDQAVLIDMPGRRAYFFWIEIWPQEVYYLTFLLMLGRVRPVPRDQPRRPGLVRLHLPADGLDRPLHVGRAPDRGRPRRAHPPRQARRSAREKLVRKGAQARRLAR